jgi:hypothetical protein
VLAPGLRRGRLGREAAAGDDDMSVRMVGRRPVGLLGSSIYVLTSRLRASWMEARVTKAARFSARLSKSLASGRLRANKEEVRSTT